jgi:hypothetical protein
LSKECLVEPATVDVGECRTRVGTAKTPLFVVIGNCISTIELSPPLSRIVGQEECNRTNNSLMARQTERHALCRVTLRDKPHSSMFDSYSFAQPCYLIESGKSEEDQRVRQQHMVNVVTTTVPAAIHKRPSHSRGLQRSHPKAPDNEGLPIPEGITMRRYATAR